MAPASSSASFEIQERGFETRRRALADVEHAVEIVGFAFAGGLARRLERGAVRRSALAAGVRRSPRDRSRDVRLAEIEIDAPSARLRRTRGRAANRPPRDRRRLAAAAEVASANSRSSGQICLPMMTTLSQSGSALLADFVAQILGGAQERVLVAPDEEHLEQLELEVAPVRRRVERLLHELRGLIVQAVRHVEIGFGDRIGLVEIDDGLARQRIVERRRGRPRRALSGRRRRGAAPRAPRPPRARRLRPALVAFFDDDAALGHLATQPRGVRAPRLRRLRTRAPPSGPSRPRAPAAWRRRTNNRAPQNQRPRRRGRSRRSATGPSRGPATPTTAPARAVQPRAAGAGAGAPRAALRPPRRAGLSCFDASSVNTRFVLELDAGRRGFSASAALAPASPRARPARRPGSAGCGAARCAPRGACDSPRRSALRRGARWRRRRGRLARRSSAGARLAAWAGARSPAPTTCVSRRRQQAQRARLRRAVQPLVALLLHLGGRDARAELLEIGRVRQVQRRAGAQHIHVAAECVRVRAIDGDHHLIDRHAFGTQCGPRSPTAPRHGARGRTTPPGADGRQLARRRSSRDVGAASARAPARRAMARGCGRARRGRGRFGRRRRTIDRAAAEFARRRTASRRRDGLRRALARAAKPADRATRCTRAAAAARPGGLDEQRHERLGDRFARTTPARPSGRRSSSTRNSKRVRKPGWSIP